MTTDRDSQKASCAFLSYAQTSHRIGVNKRTLRRMVDERLFIQPIRLRGKPMFKSEEVERWIKEKVE